MNDPKHPAKSVVDKLKSFRYSVLRTDRYNNKPVYKTGARLVEVSEEVDAGESDTFIKMKKV